MNCTFVKLKRKNSYKLFIISIAFLIVIFCYTKTNPEYQSRWNSEYSTIENGNGLKIEEETKRLARLAEEEMIINEFKKVTRPLSSSYFKVMPKARHLFQEAIQNGIPSNNLNS